MVTFPTILLYPFPGVMFQEICFNDVYDDWQRNLFSVPVGKVGTQDYSSPLLIALPWRELRWRLQCWCLFFYCRRHILNQDQEKMLGYWKGIWEAGKVGDLDSLLHECRSIQHHLPSTALNSAPSSGQIACRFAKLMMEGKLWAATRLIYDNADSFPLSLNVSVTISGVTSIVKDILLEKHLSHCLPKPSVLVSPTAFSPPPFHPVLSWLITWTAF